MHRIALTLLALLAFCGGAGATIPEDFIRQSYAISPAARVTIRNAAGRIYIYGTKAARLEVIAMRRAFSIERRDAIKVDVALEGETAVIETIYPLPASDSFLADRSGTVDYVIYLPESCALAEVKLGQGEILIEGMRGPEVVAELERGLMSVRDCFSAVKVRVEQGRLRVRYDWWEGGNFSLVATVAEGNLHVAVPAGAAMHFDGLAVGGRITNNFEPKVKPLSRLDEHYGGASAVEFTLRTSAGEIKLERSY